MKKTLRKMFMELVAAIHAVPMHSGSKYDAMLAVLEELNRAINHSLGFDLNDYTRLCHHASVTRGWWKHPESGSDLLEIGKASFFLEGLLKSQKLVLIHSEISEAMEGERKGAMDDKLPHRKMAEVELADALIRIFDYAGAFGYDLEAAVKEKMEYNAQRADHDPEERKKAGGKKF